MRNIAFIFIFFLASCRDYSVIEGQYYGSYFSTSIAPGIGGCTVIVLTDQEKATLQIKYSTALNTYTLEYPQLNISENQSIYLLSSSNPSDSVQVSINGNNLIIDDKNIHDIYVEASK